MRARTDTGTVAATPRADGVADPARTPLGRWLLLGRDGLLTAYAFGTEGLLRWTEQRLGGPDWSGPELFPVRHLTELTVAQGKDGYAHLLGRRAVPKKGAPKAVDLVHAVQYQTGRPVSPFRTLGNPHTEAARAAKLGVPAAAVDTAGTVHVLVRNAGRGLSMRREDKTGKWEGWKDLKGSALQGVPAVVATSAGPLDVLVAGEGPAGRWLRAKPAGAFERAPDIPLSVAPGSLTGLETAEGSVTYYWTDPDSGGLVSHRPGGWLVPMGGAPGPGPVSALRMAVDGGDRTVFAYRDAGGGVLLSSCAAENERDGVWWSPTAVRSAGAPALALDGRGRLVLAALSPQGRLTIARQGAGPGLVLGPPITV